MGFTSWYAAASALRLGDLERNRSLTEASSSRHMAAASKIGELTKLFQEGCEAWGP